MARSERKLERLRKDLREKLEAWNQSHPDEQINTWTEMAENPLMQQSMISMLDEIARLYPGDAKSHGHILANGL